MKQLSFRLSLILCFSLCLFACQTGNNAAPASVSDLSLESKKNQNRQVNRAMSLLEVGKVSAAKNILNEVLIFNPQHEAAHLLSQQLSQSSEVLFGTSKTTHYRVKSGDTLGEIAQRWLGDSLYFVILAKSNQIQNPQKLETGTLIKIPLVDQGLKIIRANRRSSANIELLKTYRENANFAAGLKKANALFVTDKDMSKLLQQQKLLLDDYAKATVTLVERQAMVKQVETFSETSRNQRQKKLYQQFINIHQRINFIEESKQLFHSNDYVEAAEKLVQAKSLAPEMKAKTPVFRMEKLLINKLHEQAVVFYRNHVLQKALDRWNLIRQLQPDNSLAIKYTERTQKLLEKLDQF